LHFGKKEKTTVKDPHTTVLEVASVFKDKIFWIFLFVSFVTADFLSVVYDFTALPQ
jgi:hypothetical protein